MKIVKKFQLKIVIFTVVKNCCMLYGPGLVMAHNKDADQTVHLRHLISAVDNHCLDSIMPLLYKSNIFSP